MSQTDLNLKLAAAEVAITGLRFCRGCSTERLVAGGKMLRTANGAQRWICASCQAKTKAPRR